MSAVARSVSFVAAAVVVSSVVAGTPARALAVRVLDPGGEDGVPLEGAGVSLLSVDR